MKSKEFITSEKKAGQKKRYNLHYTNDILSATDTPIHPRSIPKHKIKLPRRSETPFPDHFLEILHPDPIMNMELLAMIRRNNHMP